MSFGVVCELWVDCVWELPRTQFFPPSALLRCKTWDMACWAISISPTPQQLRLRGTSGDPLGPPVVPLTDVGALLQT